jgi:photosystem II stability/assembly factor-like uncharacterized protein
MRKYLLSFFLLAICFGTSLSQWTQIYQTDSCNCPTGRYPIFGIAFMGSDSGVISFQKTAVSINGSKTWTTDSINSNILFGSTPAITDVNHLWTTWYQSVYHTSNSGINWAIDTIPALENSLSQIYFQDSLIGFVSGNGLSVFRTTDGGKYWTQTHAPYDKPYDYPPIKIAFGDPKIGLVVGGNTGTWMIRTTDGGITWRDLSDVNHAIANGTPTGLSFPDPANAFFSASTRLYHSSDSGKTWSQVPDGKPFNNIGYRSISFVDSLHGIAVGASSPLHAAYTSDGGHSWQIFSIDTKVGLNSQTSFPDPKVAYISAYDAVFKLNIDDLAAPIPAINVFSPSLRFDKDKIIINLPEGFPVVVHVIDLLGRVIIRRNISRGVETTLELNELPPVIFVQIQLQDQLKVFKVLH